MLANDTSANNYIDHFTEPTAFLLFAEEQYFSVFSFVPNNLSWNELDFFQHCISVSAFSFFLSSQLVESNIDLSHGAWTAAGFKAHWSTPA